MVWNIPKLTLTGKSVRVTTVFHGQTCPECPSATWQGQGGNSAAKLYKRFTDLFMLDETESSTALKPKISLEMLLRDGIILGKKYFKRYQDAFFFFFPYKKIVLIFREFLVETVTTMVTFPHLAVQLFPCTSEFKKPFSLIAIWYLQAHMHAHVCISKRLHWSFFSSIIRCTGDFPQRETDAWKREMILYLSDKSAWAHSNLQLKFRFARTPQQPSKSRIQ